MRARKRNALVSPQKRTVLVKQAERRLTDEFAPSYVPGVPDLDVEPRVSRQVPVLYREKQRLSPYHGALLERPSGSAGRRRQGLVFREQLKANAEFGLTFTRQEFLRCERGEEGRGKRLGRYFLEH